MACAEDIRDKQSGICSTKKLKRAVRAFTSDELLGNDWKDFDKDLHQWITQEQIQRLQNEWRETIELAIMLENKFITMTLTEYAEMPPALKIYLTAIHNELNAKVE